MTKKATLNSEIDWITKVSDSFGQQQRRQQAYRNEELESMTMKLKGIDELLHSKEAHRRVQRWTSLTKSGYKPKQMDTIFANNYFVTALTLANGQRPGPMVNMRIGEVKRGK